MCWYRQCSGSGHRPSTPWGRVGMTDRISRTLRGRMARTSRDIMLEEAAFALGAAGNRRVRALVALKNAAVAGVDRASLQLRPTSMVHHWEQPSPSLRLPSSHSSEGSFTVLPQIGISDFFLQLMQSGSAGSSQVSGRMKIESPQMGEPLCKKQK